MYTRSVSGSRTARLISIVLLTMIVAVLGAAFTPRNLKAANASVIMPLGDSITDGYNIPGGYRIDLWQKFSAGNYQVNFVGSMANGPASLSDKDHEGHSGWRIDEIDAKVTGWLSSYQPQVILLLIGTNDILQNYNLASAPARLSSLIDKIAAQTPSARLFVASLPPLANNAQNQQVLSYNAAIREIANAKAGEGKLVSFVDMYAALTPGDLADGVHPNAAGYSKMAQVWYDALGGVLGSPTTATPTQTSLPGTNTPVATQSPTTPPGDPFAVVVNEGFEQLLPGPIDGQGGWRAVGYGAWNVASGNGGQIVTQSQGGGSSFHLNQIAYSGARFADQQLVVDFQYASNAIAPQLWARKTAVTGDGGGYFVFHWPGNNRQWTIARHQAGSGASFETLATVQGSQSPALTEGAWYSLELSVVDNSADEPVLEVYVYPAGQARPAAPLLRVVDTARTYVEGYAALGSEALAAYDGFKIFAPSGGVPPTATHTPTATATQIPTATGTAMATVAAATATATGTATPTMLPLTPTATGTATATVAAATVTATRTATSTMLPLTPTATGTATATVAAATATATGTATPTVLPLTPTATNTPTGADTFYRAVNLNGEPASIDGQAWEGKAAPNYSVVGSSFCNQSVSLNPATDSVRASMIRCSVWSNSAQVALSSVPAGSYRVFLYVWEDNSAEAFSIRLQGQTVASNFNSGPAGTWRRLGPWPVTLAANGSITLTTTGGHANLSGFEVWRSN